MGENLEVVWAKFSALSQVVLFHSIKTAWHTHTEPSKVENSAHVSSCLLKFVHAPVIPFKNKNNNSGHILNLSLSLSLHGQTLANRTSLALSFQLQKWLHAYHALTPQCCRMPNLELKTGPKQLLGSLPLVIALPALSLSLSLSLSL